MDGSLGSIRLLFLGLLIIAIIHPNFFCSGDYEVHCIESERHALLKFKQHLKDPLNRLASWAGDGDCCQWAGVVCHNVTAHVHELHLRSFPPSRDFLTDEGQHNIQYDAYVQSMFGGKINPSLLDLKHLNYLDLSNNDFSGTQIPKFLGSMGSLRYLNLSNARFEGVIPHQLGNLSYLYYLDLQGYGLYANNLQWLSSLSSLQHLDMSHVNLRKASDWLQVTSKLMSLLELRLSDCELRFIPSTTNGNFSFLVSLDLSGNFFENTFIPLWIFSLPNLVSFDLSDNGFQGPIPDDLQNMTSLKHLYLSGNHFNHPIPIWLYSFSHLKFLDLHSNNLQGTISSAIENLTSAISIDFSYNELGGKLPRSLGNLCNLREIKLSSNKWSQEISEILESLSGCLSEKLEILELTDAQLLGHLTGELGMFKNLVKLTFVYNSISGPIPMSLGNLSSLKFLDLSNNQFSGTLHQNFWQLKNLVKVTFSKNSISGPIPVPLGNLSSLAVLDFSHNQFNGTLHQNFGQFKNLVRLSIWNNSISGPIPVSLGNLSSLRFLDLANNQFKGSLPQSFGQLSKLDSLFIESNMLEGVVSEVHFSNLTRLTKLFAFGNRLTLKVSHDWIPPFQLEELNLQSWNLGPKFPQWLCSQSYLRHLDISNTGVLDVVPLSFWDSSSQFEYLNLANNLFHGEIPNCPMILSTSVIDLSSNHFNGPLPCISSNVILLDLSNNSFSGSISHLLCFKVNESKQLGFLNLEKNHLSGKIPDCWKKWKKLEFLNLGNNNFTSSIPASIGSLTLLKSLRLHNNKLSGKLQSSLKNCEKLENIDVAENDFFGSIPSWIGNKCSSLMILILRSNNFHGHIPEELCALTSLQILDLSHNKLSGSMPTCVKNFSAMATKNNSNHDLSFSFTSSYDAILPRESALLVIKGRVFEYSTILQQVKSIDISSNCLSGEIPKEVTNLQGLQSLNLSYNLLIGRIPENIGNMGSLESIDFSVNLLSGQIPSSISSLTFLSHLNLSNNNLIGKIPLSTQLQSFNASSFNGNKLCGPPLADNCTISGEQPNNGYIGAKDRGGLVVDWFYVSPLLGFVVGLWVVCGPLLYNKQWRMMYFQFLDQMWYKLKDVVSLR
ncbi:hypothetical protein ACJW30_01G216700 [Castanea mollissima]